MKTYILYIRGIKSGTIRAASHNAAEKKAIRLYPHIDAFLIQVEYTEV